MCRTLYFNTVATPRPAICKKKREAKKTFFAKLAKFFDTFFYRATVNDFYWC